MNEVPSCPCSCAQSEISAHEPNSQSIQELEHKLSRRNALVAGATATAGALALSACAEGSSGGGGGGGNGAAGPESPTDIAAASAKRRNLPKAVLPLSYLNLKTVSSRLLAPPAPTRAANSTYKTAAKLCAPAMVLSLRSPMAQSKADRPSHR